MKIKGDFDSLKEVLQSFVKSHENLKDGMEKQRVLEVAKREISNLGINRYVVGTDYSRKGQLSLEISLPTLRSELNHSRDQLKERINSTLGEILVKEIVLR